MSHANADDAADCAKVPGEELTIVACTRRIESGELSKQDLTLAYYNRGQAWFRKAYGKNDVAAFDRAIADYSETIRLDPRFAEAYAHRGFGWAVKGNFDQAFTDFDNAIRIDPKSVVSYRHRGVWRRQRGDNDRALLDFDQAIRLDPNSGVTYFDRALAWQFKGNVDRAIADYTESIARPPAPINAYGNRGALYFSKGDFDRSIADFSDGIRLDPKRAFFFKSRGEAYEQKGNFERAISDYTDAISLQQNYTAALRNRALIYERIGRPDQAIIDLRTILQSDPKQADAKESIGRMEKKIAAIAGTKPVIAAPQVTAPPVTSLPVRPGRRVALVIGNGAYQHVPALPNPPNDATDVAASFERLGFLVTRLPNARFDDMRRKLIEFGRQARGAEMAVVFYAGHGMEIGGENWLIPVDAELRTDTDAENEAVSLRAVTRQVEGATNLGLVILDACRNNPFATKMQRSLRTRAVARGFVATEPTDNVLVAYSAKDGTTANDGDGRNSPFTAALLKYLETPGLEITFVFRNVRDDVMTATKREQQPFVYGSLSKEAIYLKSAPAAFTAPTK